MEAEIVARKYGVDYDILATIKQDGVVFPLDNVTLIRLGIDAQKANVFPDDVEYFVDGSVVSASDGTATFPVNPAIKNLSVGKYFGEIAFVQNGKTYKTSYFKYDVDGSIFTTDIV